MTLRATTKAVELNNQAVIYTILYRTATYTTHSLIHLPPPYYIHTLPS